MVGNIEVVKLRKKRNVIPDGLVKAQIRNFVNLFHNLGAEENERGQHNRVTEE